jgi:ADP-ribose pyrophosphatase YjhB (NUDIX family)
MDTQKNIVIRTRAIIIDEGKLLVVRHSKEAKYTALPGGHLEWGEDIKGCLIREIIEELGITPEIGRLLYINNFIEKETRQSIEFFFEVTNSHEFKNLENLERTHAFELAEIIWASPADSNPLRPGRVWEDFKNGMILSDIVRYLNE